ncbi:hypothetical protein EMCRGX_G030565 [Ephydatia muelleri]
MRSPPLQSSLAFSLTSEQLLKPVVVMSSFLYQLEAGSPSAIGSCLNCSTDEREGFSEKLSGTSCDKGIRLEDLGKECRAQRSSINRETSYMKDKSKILETITKNVQKEMKHLTSRKSGTNLRCTVLTHFSWESVVKDLLTHAPTLHKLLKGMVQVKRKRTKATDKHSNAKASRYLSTDAVLGVCASILLRHGRNQHVNLFQKVVSLLLNSGHASAQTFHLLEEQSSITNLPGPESSTTFSELVASEELSIHNEESNATMPQSLTCNESASESISTQQLLPRSGICNEPDMWSDLASSITSVFHSNSPSPSNAPTYSEFTTNSSGYTTNESDDDDLADNAVTSNDINLATFTM